MILSSLNSIELHTVQWITVISAAILIGLSRTAISGLGMLAIPLIASLFAGRQASGMVLMMLITADLFAIFYFRQHANFKLIKSLLPWVAIGLLTGLTVGRIINDNQFKILIAICIFICLIILIISEKTGGNINIPEKKWIYALTGIATGFASMIGNVAGPIFWIYLIAKKFNKNKFMGTVAWFFFILNIVKLPLQILIWKNITTDTIFPVMIVSPLIILAAFSGTFIIKRIKEKPFRYLIILMTALAAINLVL